MLWKDRRQSGNIEDRRGISRGGIAVGGLGGIIVLIIALLLGADPRQLLNRFQAMIRALARRAKQNQKKPNSGSSSGPC
jgi:predicted metalloprotease